MDSLKMFAQSLRSVSGRMRSPSWRHDSLETRSGYKNVLVGVNQIDFDVSVRNVWKEHL